MTKTLLKGFETWFSEYVKQYTFTDETDQSNIQLKIDHTYRVKTAANQIAKRLNLSEYDLLLAETLALFHDVGRFPQYKEYKTFKDRISVNHAALSVSELKRCKVLEVLSAQEQELIYTAIMHHNIAQLPDALQGRERFFSGLLRDADKVDILYVVTNYYEQKNEVQNKTIQLELDDKPKISENILKDFLKGQIIMVGDMQYLNDFKLLQLAWINDLNFLPSLALILEAGYFERIINTLPEGDHRAQIQTYLQGVIDQKKHVPQAAE